MSRVSIEVRKWTPKGFDTAFRAFRDCLALLLCTSSGCGDHAAAGMTTPTAPAWSTCFTPSGDIDTCDKYCAKQGRGCATSCDTGTLTGSSRQAASLTWDGPACSCASPRCPAPDRATGWGEVC